MKNKYFYYTSSRIMKNTFSYIMKCLLSLYIVSYNEKYTFMYNRNVCCHYILSYIMKNKYFYYTSFCIIKNILSCLREIFMCFIYFLM